MTTCPSCNTQNEDSAKFCVSCGTPLAVAAPQAENTLACPACATANPPGAQFCISCGTPLNSGFMPGSDQQTQVSAGRVPEPSADATVLASKLEGAYTAPPPADATVLASKLEGAYTAPPPADATVLASRPEAAGYAPPPQPASPPFPTPIAPVAPAAPGRKERSSALALEILPALVGFFGIGWIYSGNVTAGVVLLIVMLVWEVLVLALSLFGALFTFGLSFLSYGCLIPINLVVIVVSTFLLYNYTKQHPERFGA